jgi:septal ring factor EnvC (AmiA/AmiB activator)
VGSIPIRGALIAALVAAVVALASAAAGFPAQEPPSDAEQRVATLRAELDRLATERASAVRDFEAADVELALRRQQLAILRQRGAVLVAEREEHAAQIVELESSLVTGRRQLRERVEALYRVGPLSYNRLLLSADNSQEALIAYQIVTYMAARDRDLVSNVRATLADLQAARESLTETAGQLAQVEADTAAATESLLQQQDERRALLSRIDREAEARRIALDTAERAANELAGTMRGLAAARDSTPGFAEARGALGWPAAGQVVGNFGRRRHPVYDTYTVSRGIEIGAPAGDPVTAVHAGRVVFADWYSGYGLLVIVDHGSDYFTLYGHLAEVTTQVNERVDAGQLIGKVGETGSLTGPNLYFEVREGSDALNPMSWLERR